MRRCIERKRYLSGREVTFECQLLHLWEGFGILEYVLEREWHVHGLRLRPGSVTYGFYWTKRPYNLYWWQDESGQTIGHYFNLCDRVELTADEFVWRDLIVDLLVLPHGQAHFIDEDEVPETLPERLRAFIDAGKRRLLQNYPFIIEEAAVALDRSTANRS